MRLPNPLRLFADLPSGQRSAPAQGSAGQDGDSRYDNLYGAGLDPNPKLSGRLRYPIFDEMRRSDPTVRSSLLLFKLPIIAAEWKVEQATDDPVDKHVADAVSWQFGLQKVVDEGHWDGRLDLTWSASLRQALLFLDWGCMFEEIIWGDVETWTDADGDPHPIRPILRLAPRAPATIEKVKVDENTGELVEVTQDVPGAKPMPGEKLAWYVMEREGDEWWGVSLLRAMYGPWLIKKGLQIGTAIGWDRHASGTPVVWYPSRSGAAGKRQAEEIGRNYRVHERGYVALEGPQGDPNGWAVEILNGATTVGDPTELLRYYDEQIATAAVQMAFRLGMTNQGSRAVGDTLADPYYLAVEAIAKEVATERMKRVVRRFVDANFGTDVDIPELAVSKIQANNVAVMAQALYDLSNAGMDFEDVDTQNWARDVLDAPHLPDDFEKPEPPAPPEGLPPIDPATGLPVQPAPPAAPPASPKASSGDAAPPAG